MPGAVSLKRDFPGGVDMRVTSSRFLLGFPLFDIVLPSPGPRGGPPDLRVARGWLAIGPIAIGLVSLGGLSVGGFALGGLAAGLIPLGGLALGGIAFGGGAVGYCAVGGAAIAAHAALGGLAAASTYALGGAAFAEHANDAAARAFFSDGFFQSPLRFAAGHSGWLVVLLVLLVILPFFSEKRPGSEEGGASK